MTQSQSEHADQIEALARAIKAGHASLVEELLEQQPELRLRLDDPMPGEAFGATPLLVAVRQGNRETVDVLLRAGASINQRSHWWAGGFGVLDDDHELHAFLIERGATVNAYSAARLGMLDRLEALVSLDPSVVRMRGGDGQTPLHVAANVDVARFLLDHGAELDALDVDHESTPAQYLIRDRQEVVRFLVGRGCRTDVLMAAALGDLALVRQHLEADPACIHMRVSKRYYPMRDPRAGGSIYGWTLGFDKTAHMIAHEFGHHDVVRELMAHSPPGLRFARACALGDRAAADTLLAERPDLYRSLSAEDARGLPDAARDDHVDVVRLMVAVGWPVTARGQHGATALHWAAWNGNAEMVRELLRAGAPIEDRANDYKGSPLDWAVHASVHGWHPERGDYRGTVGVLLQAGAQPPSAPTNGGSPAVREVLSTYARGL